MRDERPLSDEQLRDEAAPDPALVNAWKALRAARSRDADNSDDAASTLEAALDDARPEAEREAALLKVLDGGTRDALALAHAMREAAREATHRDVTPVVTPSLWARWKRPVLSSSAFVAAAAALVIVVRTLPPDGTGRQPVRGHESSLSLQTPLQGATIGDSTTFMWQAVPDALSYSITWFDSTGSIISNANVSATQSKLTDVAQRARAKIQSWQVEVVTLDGRRIKSAIQPVNRQ